MCIIAPLSSCLSLFPSCYPHLPFSLPSLFPSSLCPSQLSLPSPPLPCSDVPISSGRGLTALSQRKVPLPWWQWSWMKREDLRLGCHKEKRCRLSSASLMVAWSFWMESELFGRRGEQEWIWLSHEGRELSAEVLGVFYYKCSCTVLKRSTSVVISMGFISLLMRTTCNVQRCIASTAYVCEYHHLLVSGDTTVA